MPQAGSTAAAELHLFVIWSGGRFADIRIVDHIQDHFEVHGVHEVRWSPDRVAQNYARFYRGRLAPPYRRGSPKKGAGPLLVVTAVDLSPRYEMRDTLHGPAIVNANIFDAKRLFREWTGGGHLVHGSDTAAEATRDLVLLLGFDPKRYLEVYPEPWDGVIRSQERDLTGARGWESAGQLFHALNCAVSYLVLRNFESLPENLCLEAHDDVDLLTDTYTELIAVTNGRPLLRQIPRWGGRFWVQIDGKDVIFDFRFVGDQYFDSAWEREVLERREWCERGFFTPSAEDYFETLAYHAVVHKASFSHEYKQRLASMAESLGRPEWARAALDDLGRVKALLDAILRKRGFRYTKPLDASVFYNFHAVGAGWPTACQTLAGLRRKSRRWAYRLLTPTRALYLTVRDRLARYAPWLRTLLLRRGPRPGPAFKAPTPLKSCDAHVPRGFVSRAAARSSGGGYVTLRRTRTPKSS